MEIRWRPLTDLDSADDGEGAATLDHITAITVAADELMDEGPGDILVFLSGEGEIRETMSALQDSLGRRYTPPGERNTAPNPVEVIPLFARLSAAEQHRVFAAHPYRRIVLATNIAETSLTVPGIRYVIDPGTARISRYSPKTKVQRLPIEPISQASAMQRSGRSGRVEDGIAIRLYSEDDFLSRPEFTEPEIQRTSLASVILQMASLGLGDVAKFPFVDPPDMRAVRAGQQLLEEIGAVSTSRGGGRGALTLTPIGRQLARLPIDPRLGRMLLAAKEFDCASEVLVIVAALSVQDIRERPAEVRTHADQLHARFTDRRSDFLAYLNLWRYLHVQQRELSGSAFRRLCRAEHLNWLRFREWRDVVTQLRQLARPLDLKIHRLGLPDDVGEDAAAAVVNYGASSAVPDSDAIHQSLLTGMLSNLGRFDDRTRDYEGARGTRFVIWPGSGLHRKNPSWVMAAELVETSRLFARTVAQINPDWIEPTAKHLINVSHSEPFWSTAKGAAMVHEKVMVYGMTVVADRHVLLTSIGTEDARELAREMFIRHALVEGQWREKHHAFLAHNAQALDDAREVERRRREHGLVADDRRIEEFFADRLPATIDSSARFNQWWKRERRDNPELLNFTPEFLLGSEQANAADYPDTWIQNGPSGTIELPIDYAFSPGRHADGLVITVPVSLLPQVSDAGFDWLVPGMRDELVLETIRALPKRVRRSLVPAPDMARQIAGVLPAWEDVAHGQPDAPSFRDAFTAAARQLRGVDIDQAAWAETVLPPHLDVTFRVTSARGAVLEEGPSVERLKKPLAPRSQAAVAAAVKSAVAQAMSDAHVAADARSEARAALPASGFGDGLPASVETTGDYGTIRGYPAFVARRDGTGPAVTTQVLDTSEAQTREHRRGVLTLASHAVELPVGRVTSRWTGRESLALAGSPYPSTDALVADLTYAAVRSVATATKRRGDAPDPAKIRTQEDFDSLVAALRPAVEDEIYRIAQLVVRILSEWREALTAVDRAPSGIAGTAADVGHHIGTLVYDGFIVDTPTDSLHHLPRYLKAAAHRLAWAPEHRVADEDLSDVVAEAEDALADARARVATRAVVDQATDDALMRARWLIEELRVSLFAQQLGTPVKVSLPRIMKVIGSI